MLSPKAICLWLLGVSVCVGLAVSATVLGQQPAAGAASAGGPEEPTKAGGGGLEAVVVSAGTAQTGQPTASPAPVTARTGSRYSGYSSHGEDYGYVRYPGNLYGGARGKGNYTVVFSGKPRVPDPEMDKLLEQDAKMEQQAQGLAKQFREAEDQPQQAEARAKLSELTKQHFDLRQKRRELELSRLEEQLERVRASIKRRNEVKDLIIQRRIARLLGEEDDLAF